VDVLRRGVVEVLGSHDESREENAVPSTRHPCKALVHMNQQYRAMLTLSHSGQPGAEPVKVDQRGEKSGDLHVRALDEMHDEVLKAYQRGSLRVRRHIYSVHVIFLQILGLKRGIRRCG